MRAPRRWFGLVLLALVLLALARLTLQGYDAAALQLALAGWMSLCGF